MEKYTPGPWSFGDFWVYADDGPDIAYIVGPRDKTSANAALIAAAPDMLEALRGAVECHGPFGDDSRPAWWQAAVNAIAKAESL